jgi:phage terminase small subunit
MSKALLKSTHKLTPKQALFIAEYLIDYNATAAAKRAGYSEDSAYSTGSDLLRNPVIANEIDRRLDMRVKRLGVDADYVITTIMDVVDTCKDATSELYDPQAVLRGAELIGKTLKLFQDRVDISTDVKITKVIVDI